MMAAVEVLAWWAVAVGVWTLTISSPEIPDLVVSIVVGLPCAILARTARRSLTYHAHPPAKWLRWFALALLALVTDMPRIVGSILAAITGKRDEGSLVTRTLPPGDSAGAVGWRAAAAITVSFTPGTLVIYIDPDSGEAVMHALVRSTPAIDRAICR